MYDERDLIFSPLQQRLMDNGRWVEIQIYRLPNTDWTLEVFDDQNNSTVWEEQFETDEAALHEAIREISEIGLAIFIDQPPVSAIH